ncbi:MAG TPA: DUF5658 family protein [bacterium]|nr:DUF5658 family protein [bacterium]
MLLLFAYALMLADGIMTLVVHQEVGEVNPLFEELLFYDEILFIYCKIAVSVALAVGLAVLTKVRPRAGQLTTILAVVVYGFVAYLHAEVLMAIEGRPPLSGPAVNFLEAVLAQPATIQVPWEALR